MIVKLILAALQKGVDIITDFATGKDKKYLYIIIAVLIVLNLPNILLHALFGWMGSVGDQIQIDAGYYAGLLDKPIYFMVNDPTFPDNIPWPDDSLTAIGTFYDITWNETEMCNTIYHAYLVNEDDSTSDIMDKYTKLVEAFANEDMINPYYFWIRDTLGLELSADERLALEDCYSYDPPWEENITE